MEVVDVATETPGLRVYSVGNLCEILHPRFEDFAFYGVG